MGTLPSLNPATYLNNLNESIYKNSSGLKENEETCINCKKTYKNILTHIKRTKLNCKQFYDVDSLEKKGREKTSKLKQEKNSEYKQTQRNKRIATDGLNQIKEKHAKEEHLSRKRAIDLDAEAVAHKEAMRKKILRDTALLNNPDKVRQSDAAKKKKSRDKAIANNLDFVRKTENLKLKKF